MIEKIISGGQTGVDRAALDVALICNIAHGGWCPAGRLAEDGELEAKYTLKELELGSYRQRTKRNVVDSDGTLILNISELNGGTLATQRFTQQYEKPCYIVQLDGCNLTSEITQITEWLLVNKISKLNVAGPRESKYVGIYALSKAFLVHLCFSFDRGECSNEHKRLEAIFATKRWSSLRYGLSTKSSDTVDLLSSCEQEVDDLIEAGRGLISCLDCNTLYTVSSVVTKSEFIGSWLWVHYRCPANHSLLSIKSAHFMFKRNCVN